MTRDTNAAALRLVTPEVEVYDFSRGHETTSQRVKRLQTEARLLAAEEIQRFETLLRQAAEAGSAIAEGGDAYAVGARELASRLAEQLDGAAATLRAINLRNGG